MALPRTKYSEARHTPGGEFTYNGSSYVGWFVETYQGDFYSGKVIDDFSNKLTPIVPQTTSSSPTYVEQINVPTAEDRRVGNWIRYFIQNKNNRSIIEVTRERYNTFKENSKYTRGKLPWIIKAPAENIKKGNYIYYGADYQNRQAVNLLEKTLPGISSYIKDYSEFVE